MNPIKEKCIPEILGLRNTLKMGHCAPAVMQTLLDVKREKNDGLIKLSAGMAGGMGCGAECGGLTSPLMMIGLHYGFDNIDANHRVIERGQEYIHRFTESNGSQFCGKIRTPDAGMYPCIKAICTSPRRFAKTLGGTESSSIRKARKAHATLLREFHNSGFHCSHSVLNSLKDVITVDEELLGASWVFLGGTVLTGNTCGAFAAGVLALGLKLSGIERSYKRVMKMVMKLASGNEEEAMRDEANKFNRAINAAGSLAEWFEAEYGTRNCRDITGCSFGSGKDVDSFIAAGSIKKCRKIASMVSHRVRTLISHPLHINA